MKTQSISEPVKAIATKAAIKKMSLLLSCLLTLTGIVKAQTGTLSGKGMAICNTYSFNIFVGGSITPLNYGNQYYACTSTWEDDVSFNPQGTLWRVEKYSWEFTPTSTFGGSLNGIDENGNAITAVSLPINSILEPSNYFVLNGVNCVTFTLSGVGTLPGNYNRDSFVISTP